MTRFSRTPAEGYKIASNLETKLAKRYPEFRCTAEYNADKGEFRVYVSEPGGELLNVSRAIDGMIGAWELYRAARELADTTTTTTSEGA